MQQQNRVKAMVEGGVLAAIAIIFAMISAYLPLIGPFINLIWPVPIILLGVRHGYQWSIMATAVAGILIAVLMHPLHALAVVVGFGLIGITLGHAFRHKFSPVKTLAWGAAASLVSKAASLAITMAVVGVNPLNMQGDVMVKAAEQAISFYRSMGMQEEDLAKMSETMKMALELMQVILPIGFVGAAVVDTYLNFWVARAVLRRMGQYIEGFPPLKEWNLPRATIYVYITAMAAVYLGKSQDIILLYNIGINMYIAATLILGLQGLALFYFVAEKYNLSKFVRAIILVLVFGNGFMTQVLIFEAIYDMITDYRRLRAPR
ncbi:MAG: YybS family protein [Negativicutes bacterium]|nr:YybS family protein [Negativicutes bacterium]